MVSLRPQRQQLLVPADLLLKSFGGVAVLLGEYLLNAVFTICVQAELTTQRALSPEGWKRYGWSLALNSKVR